MKSQCITVLTKYYLDIGKKVLQVCPQKKPQQELVKRMKGLYGLDISTTLGKGQAQAMITSGLLNRNDYKDETKRQDMIKELESFDVVLVDEVEYCINPAGEFIFESIRPDILLGFSGTADKKGAKLLNLRNGLSDPTVANNATLIKYFGPALVFRLPLNLDIDDIRIESAAMNYKSLRLWEVEESGNIYLEIMSKIFTNPKVCELIVKLVEKYPRLFIPINSLQDIINHWIDNYFLGRFRILLICHEGYIYYDLQGNTINLTLQEACDKVNAGEVDVIPGTSSSFRALDMPRLDSALILSGQIAGSVIQSIGRIARSKHFNIISLDPENGGKLPVHTKGQKIREELIAEYYKYCKINKITIHENNL